MNTKEEVIKEQRERNLEILKQIMSGKTKKEVAENMDLTRERIGQIIEELTGGRKPQSVPESGLEVNWNKLKEICKALHITAYDISWGAGISADTVRHIWNEDGRYLGHGAELDSLKAVLLLVQDKIEIVSKIDDAVQYS
jgi:DNA-binding CsgD family transcriptional regulator